jgi:hypothetical protein
VLEINVRNKKTYKGEGVYIGRPSPLGNVFRITKTQTREMAVERYAIWLQDAIKYKAPEIMEPLESLFKTLVNNHKLNLICWCAPELCHGDIIKKALLHKYYQGEWCD